MLTALAYAADVAILGTYFSSIRNPRTVRRFHWANAVGMFPLIGVEAVTGAWPAVVLTAAFGVIGWVGVVGGRRRVI